jgi:CRP-like cAMP-binding protein
MTESCFLAESFLRSLPVAARHPFDDCSPAPIRLTLLAGQSLPLEVAWSIEDGYVRSTVPADDHGGAATLGFWGPGDTVFPTRSGWMPGHLVGHSRVVLVECTPSQEQVQQFLRSQLEQAAALLRISQVRPAEDRLLLLLQWIGQRFGRVNSRGTSLSLEDMNLTHRDLAEISGMTRVTVTKLLTRFRQSGQLVKCGEMDWMLPAPAAAVPASRFSRPPLRSIG